MTLVASSPFCGSINIRIQWFVSKANIYPEDLDSFLVISAHMGWIQLCPLHLTGFANLRGAGQGLHFAGRGAHPCHQHTLSIQQMQTDPSLMVWAALWLSPGLGGNLKTRKSLQESAWCTGLDQATIFWDFTSASATKHYSCHKSQPWSLTQYLSICPAPL